MIRRKLKNVIKNYTECEILVREATSNEAWGPTSSTLSKIAELSYNEQNIIQIMPMLWKRLKDKGRKWRHVYKSLLVMWFLITRGNILIAEYVRRNIHFIQSLETFTHTEENVDVGLRIRKRAGELIVLLKDNDMLKCERQKALITDTRFSKDVVSQGSNVPIKYGNGVGSLSQGPSTGSFISNSDNKDNIAKVDYPVPSTSVEEDIQLQIALAESKEEAENLKKTDEIVQLTDRYKLNLAIEKNLKENCFESEFECGLWNEEENVVSETYNDPWSPEPEKKSVIADPWSQNVASNESLWSRNAKPGSSDPWSATDPCRDGDYWQRSEASAPIDSNPWDNLNSQYSTSQNEIDTTENSAGYNPWSVHTQISSNPVPRKATVVGERDASVTRFLADHSHLVNIDSLVAQKSNQNNPFLNDSSHNNPFVVAHDRTMTETAPRWSPDSFRRLSPYQYTAPDATATNTTSSSNNLSSEINSQFKPMHYNPFLT